MHYCWKCHHEVEFDIRVSRFDVCEFCSADMRVCYNCRFHEPGQPNDCREPGTASVAERDKSNFCASFTFIQGKDHLKEQVKVSDVKSQLDSLFKK